MATEREIENLAFYAFGRTEADIQRIANSHAISQSDLAGRVLDLFSHATGREILGPAHNMSVVFGAASTARNSTAQPLALAVSSHGNVQVQGRQSSRDLILEAVKQLKPPLPSRLFYELVLQRTGLHRTSAYGVVAKMIKAGDLQKKQGAQGFEYLWPAHSNGATNGAAIVDAVAQPKPVKKKTERGYTTKLIVDYLAKVRNPQTQAHICQHMVAKHPEVPRPAWNGVINVLTRLGVLHRDAKGIITLGKKQA